MFIFNEYLLRYEYLAIKKFMDNNIDIIESALAPMNDYFDSYKKCYGHYYCSCYYYHKKKVMCIFPQNKYKEFHKKIIKSYFNKWYIKFFYLLQKNTTLNKNLYNISVRMNLFMNLYDNSSIYCNKKIKIKYMICMIILFLINLFIVINIKIVLYLLFINKAILLLIPITTVVYSGVIWETLISNPTNTISLPTIWGHLDHFGLGSILHNYYNLNCELMP